MLSRLAENLYWMGRYIERAENTARLLDVNYHAMVEAPNLSRGLLTEQWAPLLSITGDAESFKGHFERADRNTVPEWLSRHPDNPSSISGEPHPSARKCPDAPGPHLDRDVEFAQQLVPDALRRTRPGDHAARFLRGGARRERAFFRTRRGDHAARPRLALFAFRAALGARRQRVADSSGALPAVQGARTGRARDRDAPGDRALKVLQRL